MSLRFMPCDPLEIVTDSADVICQSKPWIDAQPVPIVALFALPIVHFSTSPQSNTISDLPNLA